MSNQTICVIDDNESFRQSTRFLLEGLDYDVIEFGNPEEAVNDLRDGLKCDCILVDVRMPGLSGLDVHDQLITLGLRVPVIYMTGHGDIALAVEAMKKGAVTFLEKPLNTEALHNALKRAEKIKAKATLTKCSGEAVTEFKENLRSLTPRELEIMHSIVDGKANKVIAFDLGISHKTVELHRSRVMKKLPIRSSQELVKMVMLSQ